MRPEGDGHTKPMGEEGIASKMKVFLRNSLFREGGGKGETGKEGVEEAVICICEVHLPRNDNAMRLDPT
jgi:hypothetical protein